MLAKLKSIDLIVIDKNTFAPLQAKRHENSPQGTAQPNEEL